jgi:hypothetical protein
MDKYTRAPDGATNSIARRDFKCAACGKTTECKMRGQRFCSRRCRQRANYADKVARGDFSTPNTALPTTPHKSASNIKELQGATMGSSPYSNAPLNILGGGSFRWPNTPKLDRRTLENIERSEVGAAP